MKIAYLLESTGLCGGVKVVFNQAAALRVRGHRVIVLAKQPYPDWLQKNVPFREVSGATGFGLQELEPYQIIVATSPMHLLQAYQALKAARAENRLVHFIQGYEGDYREAESFMDHINRAYTLPVPKITISADLSARLLTYYPQGIFECCGQGLERELFHPPAEFMPGDAVVAPDWVFIVGPLEISVKKIAVALEAFRIAANRRPELKLIRISTVDTRERELPIAGAIHEYHVNLPPERVAELFRSHNGILLSPSSPGEGFGLPALEAMACGLPVVLTDIPSYRSFGAPGTPRDYALFVPVDDAPAMAAALLEVVGSRAIRKVLINRGLAVAETYSYGKVAEKMEAFFQCVKKD